MGIPVRSSHHEVSMNQHEIGLRHTDALTMADSIISTRLIVKQTALNHQGFATFMPRPFGNLNGNGLHLYLSLYQGDENIFYSKSTKNNLSKSGESFMAGILEYSAEMSILTNQWINSYKRLLPNLEAPVAGKDLSNRMSDIVRIPHIYQEDKHNARIEFRLPDSACNPYLTFSAILHAGLLGIRNNMKIEKKWKSNIPSSLYEAIKVSENSNFLKDAIGNEAYNSILENKEKEWIEHHSVVTDYERKYYMKFL
jgi:glutamine synthetase